MAKAELKKKVEGGIPAGMQAKDLSVEKRAELYKEALEKFDKEASALYGISFTAQVKYAKQGIVPIIVFVDMLDKKDEKQNKPTKKEEPAKA